MRVEVNVGYQGTFVDGVLKGVIKSEQDAPFPQFTVEMHMAGRSDPVRVTFDELDLSTIVRLARESKVDKLRDAVRQP